MDGHIRDGHDFGKHEKIRRLDFHFKGVLNAHKPLSSRYLEKANLLSARASAVLAFYLVVDL